MGEATGIANPARAARDARRVATGAADAASATANQPPTVINHHPTIIDDQPHVVDDQPIIIPDGPAPAAGRSPRVSRMRPLLRRQSGNPEEFYRYLAQDTVRHLRQHLPLDGARAVDIGGGPGYVADELLAAGARSCVIADSTESLYEGQRHPDTAVIGDCQVLPLATSSVQVVHSANVLEHVSLPYSMLAEMVRVLQPREGIGYLTFTNWYSPWGHEPAPWPTLASSRASRRCDPRTGAPLHTDYPLRVNDVLRWFETRRDVEVLWSGPRYLPPWLRWIVAVPGVREAFSWNLVVVFRKRWPR